MKLQFNCAKCKKLLGFYEGIMFWINPGSEETSFLCEECYSVCQEKNKGVNK